MQKQNIRKDIEKFTQHKRLSKLNYYPLQYRKETRDLVLV